MLVVSKSQLGGVWPVRGGSRWRAYRWTGRRRRRPRDDPCPGFDDDRCARNKSARWSRRRL